MFFVIWGRIKGGIFIAEKKNSFVVYLPWAMVYVDCWYSGVACDTN